MNQVGILALQGCVTPHSAMLKKLGRENLEVRTADELAACERLIIPGGESTTMLYLLKTGGLFEAVKNFTATKPVWGVCAGAILLAKEAVRSKHSETNGKSSDILQESLNALPIRAYRNHYGSQLNSFTTEVHIQLIKKSLHVDFIRAPKLVPLSNEVSLLSELQGTPVLMQYKNIMVSAFHAELQEDPALHEYFLLL
jgi:pyridoxal 5'-phosphate synthase pdxT subunit